MCHGAEGEGVTSVKRLRKEARSTLAKAPARLRSGVGRIPNDNNGHGSVAGAKVHNERFGVRVHKHDTTSAEGASAGHGFGAACLGAGHHGCDETTVLR
jgi:hypothetical protein